MKRLCAFILLSLITCFGGSLYVFAANEQPANIDIVGAEQALADNILAHLRFLNEPCSTSLVRMVRFETQAKNDIQTAAKALGFYHISTELIFSENDGCWNLLINITPGEQVLLNNIVINIEAPDSLKNIFNDVLQNNNLQSGQALNQGAYESLKSELSAVAVENGFFTARFSRSELVINTTTNLADIFLNFEPGIQFTLGQITLQNETILEESFIQRLISVNEGEAYTSPLMITLREDLDHSQFFDGIKISPTISSDSDFTVPILVSLIPKPRHAYSAGIGFTTDTGPRLKLAYDNRYVTTKGHSFESDFSLSQVRSEIDTVYRIPLWNPATQHLNFRLGFLQEDTDSYESDRFNLETNFSQEFQNGWLGNFFVSYQKDDYIINAQQDNSTLTILGVNMSKTRADNLVFPSRGWHFFSQIRGASDALLSDTSFVQAELSAKYIIALGGARLISRFDGGTTWTKDENELPASLRYFSGGDQSVRGYKYQTLGPVDISNQVVGGKHLLNSSVEMDFGIRKNWRGAVFYDVGNAFSDFDNIDWKHSVGLGIRWLSPIGPVRADIAHPIQDGGVRLHITMGPDL